MRTFVDTNVLVSAFDTADPDQPATAQDVLNSAAPQELVVSAQVLNEFWVTVTAKLARPLPPDRAARVVADLVASVEVVPIDAGLVLAGIDRHLADGLSLWDALVVEAARASGCTTLLTEDLNHGQDHDGVTIHNSSSAGGDCGHGPGPRNAEGHNLGPCTGSAEGSALVVNGR